MPRGRTIATLTAALALAALWACRAPAGGTPTGDEAQKATTTIADLQVTDLQPGSGATATRGRVVRVHYTGWLYHPDKPDTKGRQFDSSLDRGEPFEFPLGQGRVIQGWDEGVEGMKAGGRRRLVIPAAKAYGARGAGDVIPPDATLVFDVELLEVR